MVKFLVAVIPALLVIAISIFSVQNATPVAVTFLSATTVKLPVGIWAALALAIGMLGTSLLLGLFGKQKPKSL
ncbi:MAG: DUF1049 domain-containing protein [Cyanobacteria bacterium J06560_2]